MEAAETMRLTGTVQRNDLSKVTVRWMAAPWLPRLHRHALRLPLHILYRKLEPLEKRPAIVQIYHVL